MELGQNCKDYGVEFLGPEGLSGSVGGGGVSGPGSNGEIGLGLGVSFGENPISGGMIGLGSPSFWPVLSIDRDGEACIKENPNLTGSLD